MSTKQIKNPFEKAKLYRYPQGDILQLFGENPELYSSISSLGLTAHNGIDVYQPYGTKIRSVCDGVVADIKDDPNGFGRHIRIVSTWEESVGYEITYGHLSKIRNDLEIGSVVLSGSVIGECGNSGFVVSENVPYWGGSNPDRGGTHLHFGIRELSVSDTGWKTSYPIGDFYVKNYKNGFCGAVDPMPFFREEIEDQARSVIQLAKRVIAEVMRFLNL